jgi:uncharacterized protein (DUF4415 family)
MSEQDVEQAAAEEMIELGVNRKERITMRLDPETLGWFKARGRGYQSRMQAVLRAYVEAHRQ